MKSFKELYESSYYGGMKDTRPKEIIDADRHVMALISADQDHRRYGGGTPPIENNREALYAIRHYYLGKKHPELHQEHAKNLEKYRETVEKAFPHLVGFLIP
jgi:hypothetical protein